jgi:hypothetical protein
LERNFKPKSLKSKLGIHMKKVLFTALVTLGLVASFSGCSKKEEAPAAAPVETVAPAAEAAAPAAMEANATEAAAPAAAEAAAPAAK